MLRKTPPSKKWRAERRTEKRNKIGTEKSEERKRGTNRNGKVWRAEKRNKRGTDKSEEKKRNDIGTEKSDERKRGMQKKNGKEHAAGEEQIELHLYYVIVYMQYSWHSSFLFVRLFRSYFVPFCLSSNFSVPLLFLWSALQTFPFLFVPLFRSSDFSVPISFLFSVLLSARHFLDGGVFRSIGN